jgi:hypothetical protein
MSFRVVSCVLFSVWSTFASAQPTTDIPRAVDTMVRLCLAGGHIQTLNSGANGGAAISLRSFTANGQVAGDFRFTESTAEGLVNGIDNAITQVAATEADKVRDCLKPVRDRLLDIYFGPSQSQREQEGLESMVSRCTLGRWAL